MMEGKQVKQTKINYINYTIHQNEIKRYKKN